MSDTKIKYFLDSPKRSDWVVAWETIFVSDIHREVLNTKPNMVVHRGCWCMSYDLFINLN